MPEYDFSSEIPDEKIIVTLGRGSDKVRVDLSFIPSENGFKLIEFRNRLTEENRDPTLDEIVEMAVIICEGLVEGHEVTAEWLKKKHTIQNLSGFLDVALKVVLGIGDDSKVKNSVESDGNLNTQSLSSDSTMGGRGTIASKGSVSGKYSDMPTPLSSKLKKTG